MNRICLCAHWKLIVDAKDSNRWRDFQNATPQLLENWATFMETIFAIKFVDSKYNRFSKTLSDPPLKYYDHKNKTIKRCDFFREINEQAGYSAKEMEQALIGASSLYEWKENLKDLYDGNENKLEKIYKKYPY